MVLLVKNEITKREEYNPEMHSATAPLPLTQRPALPTKDVQPMVFLLLLPSVTLLMWLQLTRKTLMVTWELLFYNTWVI